MIRWIQNRPWQSNIFLALFSLCLFGGLDSISIGLTSLAVALTYAVSVLLARDFAWTSILLIITGSALSITFQIRSGATGGICLLALALLAAFGSRVQRYLALAVTSVSGIAVLYSTVYQDASGLLAYDIGSKSELGQLNIFLFGVLLILATATLSWLAGRLLITRATHVGTAFDRAVAERIQAQQALEIAEQNKRFQIARDISELIIQRVSASISLAEGGVYATQADPSTASRILEKVAESARAGHKELRRLFDMLNKKHEITAAPPRIDDLDALVIAFRQTGYNINLRHEGQRFEIDEGAELAVYRIVFDALENIRKHAPVGTDITIDFSWTDNGLQVLIKDNGVELSNRGLSLEELTYTIEEDRKALVDTIVGAGLTAMSERAGLYGGTIEASRVPGVGFTVSAIFPDLKNSARA
ncbi:MAG: sensor histidine kinase [Micrococcales bacterium]